MSLEGFYFNKQSVELNYPGSKYLYNYILERDMAKDRLRDMFKATKNDLIIDEVFQ